MATSRPFTYNNGPLISGSIQIGNLAIGSDPLDYSSQPGGKTWWMGPDEDNRYIIGKDVPSSDWSTPVGDVGSVRFWASPETDSDFLSMFNDLPARQNEDPITSISTAYNWLISNGYYTNITNSPDFSYPLSTKWEFIRVPYTSSDAGTTSTSNIYFNSNDDLVYEESAYQIYFFNMSQVPLEDDNSIMVYITASGQSPNNSNWVGSPPTDTNTWFQDSWSIANYSFRDYNFIHIDTTNNDLYSMSPSSATYGFTQSLMRFDLTNKLVADEVSLNQQGRLSYDSNNDKLFLTNTLTTTRNSFTVYTGSNLTTPSESLDTSTYGTPGMILSNDNITISLLGYKRSWLVIDNETLTFTSESVPTPPANSIYGFDNNKPGSIAYNPVTNKFYIYIESYTNKSQILIIDGDTGEYEDIIEVQSGGQQTSGLSSDLVYDPNRNAIWGINRSRKFFALNCSNNTLFGEFRPQGYTQIDTIYQTNLALDSTNDILVWAEANGVKRNYNLNLMWPI